MKSLLLFLRSYVLRPLVGLLIVSGMLVAAARLLLPYSELLRDKLAEQIGASLETSVLIQGVEMQLSGVTPELALRGVTVLDKLRSRPIMHFRELRLSIDPWQSFLQGSPRLQLATLLGAQLYLVRDRDGTLILTGIDSDSATDAAPPTPVPFLGTGHFRLRDSEVLIENRRLGLPPFRITGVNADLVSSDDRHHLRVQAELPAAGTLDFRANLTGPGHQPQDWQGDLYLQVKSPKLGTLVSQWLPADQQFDADAYLESWGHLLPAGLDSLTGQLQVAAPHYSVAGAETLRIDQLSTWFQWTRRDDGWQLALDQFQITPPGGDATPGDLLLRITKENGQSRQIQASSGQLWLQHLAALLPAILPDPQVGNVLRELAPQGEIADGQMLVRIHDDAPPDWQVTARVRGMRSQPWNGIPGLGNLNFLFAADQNQGQVVLDSQALELNFPTLFRWPLNADRLAGLLRWNHHPQGIDLVGDQLILENADLRTRSNFFMRLAADSSPFIDLRTDFFDGVGAATPRYLPLGVMPQSVIDWLDRAVVSGTVPQGFFLLRGRLADFPFYNRQGRFEVQFDVENILLDYQEGWPPLKQGRAKVRFLNEGMDIQTQEARLLDSRVLDTRIWIPDIKAKVSVLIEGQVEGPFSDGLKILRETPLADEQARYVQGMVANGPSRLALNMAIPVEGVGEFKLDGRLTWPKETARLEMEDWDLSLDNLKGALKFTHQGVFADDLRAQLWGLPLTLDLTTTPSARNRPSMTKLDARLPLNPKQLAKAYPRLPWNALAGETSGDFELEIEHSSPGQTEIPFSYRFKSDLQGLTVNLPIPLTKAPKEARPLLVSGTVPLPPNGRISARYGDLQASFKMDRDADGNAYLAGVNVQHNGAAPPSPPETGVFFQGQFSRLDLPGWAEWLNALPPSPTPRTPDKGETRVKLAADDLDLGLVRLTKAQISATRMPRAWNLEARSEQLTGRIRWPDRPREEPITARLETLRLNYQPGEATQSTAPKQERRLDPAQGPAIDLQLGALFVNEHSLGGLVLATRPLADGLRLERLILEGPELTFKGSGEWTGTAARPMCRIHLDVGTDDLGQTLKALKLTDAIGEAKTQIKADLQWAASPFHATLANIAGDLEVAIGPGRVLDANPGGGRILGLFNLGALGRRLGLDFSDLFTTGFTFDQIDGRFGIAQGNADIRELRIQGPAAQVDVTGRAALLTRQYDQLVTVIPEISTTLPVAGAIAGGPVGAAVMLIAEQVVGDQVNKLSRYQYKVTGSWDDPTFTPIKTQDGWSISNILHPAQTEQPPQAPPEGSDPAQ